MAAVVLRTVPDPAAGPRPATPLPWTQRLRHTLSAPGPWLLALTFACYSGQWLAVVGFLPTIYREAGFAAALTGVLTAAAAAANMVGNIGSGRLLHRGVAPQRLLAIGFVTMALGSALAFADLGLPAWLRYAAVLAFSGGRPAVGTAPCTASSAACLTEPHHPDRALARRRQHRPPPPRAGRTGGQDPGPEHHRREQARRRRHARPQQHGG
jgi:predicted MFS family arabinose efflux permease